MTSADATLLLVDDDDRARFTIRQYFSRMNFVLIEAENGREAIHLTLAHHPDLIIMDVMMPVMDGFDACRELRQLGIETPILFLSTRTEIEDRLKGLEHGADDYLAKPFSLRELELRVRVILRRRTGPVQPEGEILVRGDLRIDLARHVVSQKGKELDLTPTEFKILHVLAARPGRVFSRDRLLDEVWGNEYDGFQRNIDPHINRLRAKLELPDTKPMYILTVWGEGYKFNEALLQALIEGSIEKKG